MGAGSSIKEAAEFFGSGAHPAYALKTRIPYGTYVSIDVDKAGSKNPETGAYSEDVTLKFGRVIGVCPAPGHNAVDYTVQVDDGEHEIVRRRFLQILQLPELEAKGIEVGRYGREVGVEVEWEGNQCFLAELLRRENGLYDVRFKDHKREVMYSVPISRLHAVDENTRVAEGPEKTEPDPVLLQDRKVQKDIDVEWPIAKRIKDTLQLLRLQMRPPTAPPLRGPFVGASAHDSEGFPALPVPPPELKVDGSFVDTWGKFAGKIKFATTYKVGPSYPRMDAWVDRIDVKEPLYFHAALPVYAGLICLGMYRQFGDDGPGEPEWVQATDVALVGIALYVNGELVQTQFTDPPLEKNGYQRFGHDSCHFIPGCSSTYMADSAWIGGVFCLAPTENDFEVEDDIFNIRAYHKALKDWWHRPREPGKPHSGPREVDVQVNLVLTTNYLATVRQVCAGSVKVIMTEQGLATAVERMKDVEARRLPSEAAKNPKRPRKMLAQTVVEEGELQRLELPGEEFRLSGSHILRQPPPPIPQSPAHLPHQTSPTHAAMSLAGGESNMFAAGNREMTTQPSLTLPDAAVPNRKSLSISQLRRQQTAAMEEETMRSTLEARFRAKNKNLVPPPPPPKAISGMSSQSEASSLPGNATSPIRGPDAPYRHLLESPSLSRASTPSGPKKLLKSQLANAGATVH